MTRSIKLVLAQLNPFVGDIEGNAELMAQACLRARDEVGADLILFPELMLTGYPPEDLLLRASLHDRCERALQQLSQQVRGIDVVLGLPWRENGQLFNAAVLLRDGERLGPYFKQRLPNYSVFDEKRYFSAGQQALVVEVAGVPMGITICEDIWGPEPAQKACDAGAQLILNINASPYHLGKGAERLSVLRQRVTETGLPIVYLNMVGGQDELVFDGHSLAVDASGELHLSAPPWQTGLYALELTVDAQGLRLHQGVMAPEQTDEASLYDALVTGVRDYVQKNGFHGVVLGLSGGIDSALTLCIAVDALGADAVEALMMPYHYTADISREDAKAQAELLGVKFDEISIAPMVESFMQALERPFAGLAKDATEENIQARCRGMILMAFSNKTGRMLLTTGNKSEMAVGYATLYGDMAGGFAPLKDVSKLWVYRLAGYRNMRSPAIPERVLQRPPSAELAPDQMDQDSLPPYEILDVILERFVEQDASYAQIVAEGFDAATVERVISLVLRNEYKRRQAPPGVRVTRRNFGKDRRYPITSGYGRLLH